MNWGFDENIALIFVRPLFVRLHLIEPLFVKPLFVKPLIVRPLFVRQAALLWAALCWATPHWAALGWADLFSGYFGANSKSTTLVNGLPLLVQCLVYLGSNFIASFWSENPQSIPTLVNGGLQRMQYSWPKLPLLVQWHTAETISRLSKRVLNIGYSHHLERLE